MNIRKNVTVFHRLRNSDSSRFASKPASPRSPSRENRVFRIHRRARSPFSSGAATRYVHPPTIRATPSPLRASRPVVRAAASRASRVRASPGRTASDRFPVNRGGRDARGGPPRRSDRATRGRDDARRARRCGRTSAHDVWTVASSRPRSRGDRRRPERLDHRAEFLGFFSVSMARGERAGNDERRRARTPSAPRTRSTTLPAPIDARAAPRVVSPLLAAPRIRVARLSVHRRQHGSSRSNRSRS